MKDLIIYGAGGLGRGVAHLIETVNEHSNKWNLIGFIDDSLANQKLEINGYPLIGGSNTLVDVDLNTSFVIAVANPIIKKNIVNKLEKKGFVSFPNIIHPSIEISNYNELGIGNIITKGVVFSTNITVGNFCLIHFNSTIGHDVKIRNYCTIHPQNSISGFAEIKSFVTIGTNSSILPNVIVGESSIVGAGSVVTRDIDSAITVVGSPARKLIKNTTP